MAGYFLKKGYDASDHVSSYKFFRYSFFLGPDNVFGICSQTL